MVTGGHGDEAVEHLFDGETHHETAVSRHDVLGDAWRWPHAPATLAALLARRVPLSEAHTRKPRESPPKQSGTDSSRSAAAKGWSTSCDWEGAA